jgi:Fic family protein
VIKQPLLYLSHYLKRHRTEYYDRLQATRDKAKWDDWLEFILRGVRDVSHEATRTSRNIIELRQRHQQALQRAGGASGNLLRLHESLFKNPVLSAGRVERALNVSAATANSLIRRMEALGILKQTTAGRRNRKFMYTEYVDLFQDATDHGEPDGDAPEF